MWCLNKLLPQGEKSLMWFSVFTAFTLIIINVTHAPDLIDHLLQNGQTMQGNNTQKHRNPLVPTIFITLMNKMPHSECKKRKLLTLNNFFIKHASRTTPEDVCIDETHINIYFKLFRYLYSSLG